MNTYSAVGQQEKQAGGRAPRLQAAGESCLEQVAASQVYMYAMYSGKGTSTSC